ncbi:hypothetical protein FF1_019193 [Malus domestica]
MIKAAIEALNNSNRSSKFAIVKHIESTYGDLLESHTALLAYHLNKMEDTSELVLVKNNYMKPDPNAVHHPLRTKVITVSILSAISDIMSQKLTGIQKLQIRRLLLKVMIHIFSVGTTFIPTLFSFAKLVSTIRTLFFDQASLSNMGSEGSHSTQNDTRLAPSVKQRKNEGKRVSLQAKVDELEAQNNKIVMKNEVLQE